MTRNEAKKIRANIEKTASFADDKTALESVWMYPKWVPGAAYESGQRFVYGGRLYRVIVPHTSQTDWIPGVGTESLYERINESHAGTLDDPIPYDGNMALENGKYYTQDGVTYLCTRDSGNPLYNKLVELVGHYVELA